MAIDKRKHQRFTFKPPTQLILKGKFEFQVNLPMHLCMDRLRVSTKDKACLSLADENRVEFKLYESGFRTVYIWAFGCLEAIGDNTTRISGKTGVGLGELVFYLSIAPITFGMLGLVFGPTISWLVGIVFGLILDLWILVGHESSRERLGYKLREIFGNVRK